MTFTQFNRIVEIRTKIISMGTFISASFYASLHTDLWSWPRFIVMAIAVFFVDMGTTGFNSYFDFINGTDNQVYNLEKDKVLVHEGVHPNVALAISLSFFGIAAVLGLLLAWWTSWYLLLAGAISMAVGFLYTGGPYPISRTPFGELFAGGFLGSVLFMITNYVLTLSFTKITFLVSIPHLLLIALILTVNNSCDRIADSIAGRKTLSILLSEKMMITLMKVVLFLSFALAALFSQLSYLPWPTTVTMILAYFMAYQIYREMEKRGFSLETKGVSMSSVSQIFLIYCLAFTLGSISGYFV